MNNMQKLEEKILDCWGICEDLDTIFSYFYEANTFEKDKFANLILGIKELYSIKFEDTFHTYEESLKEYYDEKRTVKTLY